MPRAVKTAWTRTKAVVVQRGGDIPFAVLRELLVSTGPTTLLSVT